MSDNIPLVSIITLNYNQTALTLQLLESLEQLTYPNIEIIVCDMKSNDDQVAMLQEKSFAKTRYLCSPVNLGFAGGNNWGAANSAGEYLLFLNNDTEVEPTLVSALLTRLQLSPDIGAVSPKINRYNNQQLIEYAGFHPMNFYTGRTTSVGFDKPDADEYNCAAETASVHGCAMMMERNCFNSMKGFCEDYFLYYEEWDISMRLKKKGMKLWYEPSTTVYHKDGKSIGVNNPLKQYYLTRNRILFVRRHAAREQLFVFILFLTFCSIPLNIFRMIIHNQFRQLDSFLKAVKWNLLNRSTPKCDLYTRKLC